MKTNSRFSLQPQNSEGGVKFYNLVRSISQRLLILVALLLSMSSLAMADDVTLFTADFTNLGTYEASYFSTNATPTEIAIDGRSVKFLCNATDKGNYSITSTSGLTFPENNMGNKYFVAIPISDINGSITVTFSHSYSSSTASFNALFIGGDYVSNPLTSHDATNAKDANKKDTSCSATFETTETSGYLYLGRASGNFTNVQSITITTPDGQVTPTIATPTLSATNITIEKGSTGSSTITATANGSTVNNLTYSYEVTSGSSNASVNSTTGVVTGLAAGTATVTVTSAAVENTYNSASTTFTVTVTDNSTPSAESTKWDFSTMTSDEIAALKANTTYFTTRTQNDYVYSTNSTYWPKNTDISIQDKDGADIPVFEGLKIFRSSDIGNQIRIYYNSGEKRLYLGGTNYTIKLPTQAKGSLVKVTWNTTNNNTVTISGSNMTATENFTSSSNSTKVTTCFSVTNDGEVAFIFNSNAQIYKIEVVERTALTTFAPRGAADKERTVSFGTTITDLSIIADPMAAISADKLSIESSNASVVDVSSASPAGIGSNSYFLYGGIVAVGEGTATLTIKFAGDDNYEPAECTVTIHVTDDRSELTRFSPMGGDDQKAKANISYNQFEGAETKAITNYCFQVEPYAFSVSDFEIVSSSDETIVPLSSVSVAAFSSANGRLLINYTVNKKVGESTITVRFKGNENYKTTTCTMTVTVTDNRMKLTLGSDDYRLVKGTSYTPAISAIDANGNDVSGLDLTLTSSHNRVTVDGMTLTASTSSTGNATITINFAGNDTYQPAKATFKVTVVGLMPIDIESSTITLLRNSSASILDHITLVDANGNAINDDLSSLLSIAYKDAEGDHKGVSISGMTVSSSETIGKVTLSITFAGNDTYDATTEDLIVEVIKISTPVISSTGQITQAQDATVYYTTDGTDPRTSETRQTGTLPINLALNDTQTIYAVATDGTDMSSVSELNYVNPAQTYQYTLEDSGNTPGVGKKVVQTDGSGNTIMRMTYGDLPEYVQKYSSIWKSKARDGRMRDAEFDDYQMSTIAENYDGTNENSYNTSNGYGLQFVGYNDNTPFSLPIAGAYVKFEPEVDGKLQVVIRQNGSFIDKETDGDSDLKLRRRVVYIADETGRALTPGTEYSAQMNLNSKIDPKLYTYTTSNVQQVDLSSLTYYKTLLYGSNISDAEWTAKAELDALDNRLELSLPEHTSTGDDLGDVQGYLCVTKAYVKYTLNVEAGKTYFLTGNLTKVGLCGYQFTPDASYSAESATLEEGTTGGNASSANSSLLSGTVGRKYNVAITRTFEADQWATLVLPFSVSVSKVKEVFGDNTLILNFNDVTTTVNENGTTVLSLNLRKHYHQMIVAGMPLLIKPSATASNPIIKNVTLETLDVEPMSQDTHKGDSNYQDNFKLDGSYEPAVMPAFAYYMSDNQFKQKSNGKTTNTKGMRAWISGATQASPAKINAISVFEDFDPTITSIDVVEIADAIGVTLQSIAPIYNLNGQKVSANGNRDDLPCGIYIQNGKKFIVR